MLTVAKALITYYAQYGIVQGLRCDEGSEFTNGLVQHIHQVFDIPMRYSLVRRHESSGAERTIREVRRHLMAIMHEDREYDQWSDPTYLSMVQFLLNDSVNAETGYKPFTLQYGSQAAIFHSLPEALNVSNIEHSHEYLQRLDAFLARARQRSNAHMASVQEARAKGNPNLQTSYQPGDQILYDNRKLSQRNKVRQATWEGPFTVERQLGNKIVCTHTGLKTTHTLHAEDVKVFHGSLEQAKAVATFDKQQAEVECVLSHHGRIHTVTDLRLDVLFKGGAVQKDKELDEDLQRCEAFHAYAEKHPYLLRFAQEPKERAAFIQRTALVPYPTYFQEGATCFVDMHAYNIDNRWYDRLGLPDMPTKTYFARATLKKAETTVGRTKAQWDLKIDLFGTYACTQQYAHDFVLPQLPEHGLLADRETARLYPQLLDENEQPDLRAAPPKAAEAKRGGAKSKPKERAQR
jgi:hypothetical protein